MEGSKKQKAIIQAHASLKIDRIYLKPSFIFTYVQNQATHSKTEGPKLTLKRGTNNGINT